MKKILYLFSASLIVLTSCSNDDDSNDASTANLLKEVTYIEGSYTSSSKITYDGNKVVQIVSGADKTVYTYTGNLITKEEEFAGGNNIDSKVEYSYENNKLKTAVSTEISGSETYKSKNVYTYNSDGTVNYKRYNVNVTTGAETLSSSGKYTYLNGNVVKNEDAAGYSSTYEYDTKNNPTKNILGFDKLLDEEFSVNNIVKRTSAYNGTNPTTSTNEYDYNTDGYPTEQRSFYNGGANGITKYSY
jgi:hypothetical protein